MKKQIDFLRKFFKTIINSFDLEDVFIHSIKVVRDKDNRITEILMNYESKEEQL